jgi:hypothetical protein
MADLTEDKLQPLPAWLSGPVGVLMADFQQPSPVGLRVAFDAAEQILWFWEADGTGSGFSFGWLGEDRGAVLLVALADWLQEQVFPESREAWGEARPACPGHSHPAHASLVGDEAWWTCPLDGHQIAKVGSVGR